ncbi:MAG: RNA polymerase sigma factor [Myxococcota bacterium]
MEGVIALDQVAVEPSLEARFEALVTRHRDRAVRLAWRLVGGDLAAAEDVTQEALVRAFRGLRSFRGDAQLDTWFYRIVARQAYSYVRWRRVRERFAATDPDQAGDPAPGPEGDPLLRERIGRALDALSRGQREAFVLVHMEGFTLREAAEIMGKADGTVHSHLHRALSRLRSELEGTLGTREERDRDPATP